ncbi:hypothetical protein [Motilibacter aurantiacus]|uniref:hypothetical protein n=1 Tax=Motilibacter aurantiacus TaxID=2714955 RepID=UPI00140B3D37|nr:hypothetical protein [Motilibacter aurantiacus]NHC47557.1 hypothetical protein [Motilibacter aurantiacus]
MSKLDERMTTPVGIDDDGRGRVKVAADVALEAYAQAMQRYASSYLAHRVGELEVVPDPASVGCDTAAAAVVRSVVEQALHNEVVASDPIAPVE